MLAFGLGTLPNMLALGWTLARVQRLLDRRVYRYSAAAIVAGFALAGLYRVWFVPAEPRPGTVLPVSVSIRSPGTPGARARIVTHTPAPAMSDDDPRRFPPAADAPAECRPGLCHRGGEPGGGDRTGRRGARARSTRGMLAGWLAPGQGGALARLFAGVPSVAVYRQLWRLLVECERAPAQRPGPRADAVRDAHRHRRRARSRRRVDDRAGGAPGCDGIGGHPARTRRARRQPELRAGQCAGRRRCARPFQACRTFWRGDRCRIHARRRRATVPPRTVGRRRSRSPMATNGAHLRFLVGSALAAPEADPLRDRSVARWGIPCRAGAGGAAAPARRVAARASAGAASPHRRRWRPDVRRSAKSRHSCSPAAPSASCAARWASPRPSSAFIASTRRPAAARVRLSLSSPYDPREAEGFRCPLTPSDDVEDVVRLLTDLMHDCRVTDVRREPGVHADRDPVTGLTLLFKSDRSRPAALH